MKKILLVFLASILCITFGTSVAPAQIANLSAVTLGPVQPSTIQVENQVNTTTPANAQVEAQNAATTNNTATTDNTAIQNKSIADAKPQAAPSKPASKTNSVSAPTPSKVSSPPTSSKASAIISTAKQYIGVPYVFGGTTPQGFDCSGFVQYVFAKNGISLPRVSRDQFGTGKTVALSALQPADLIFFSLAQNGIVDHVGIYIGGGQFINAASSKGVTIYSLGPYWNSHVIGAKREI